uniref:Uncharacterized protein n=1 Tax=Triticum urartu TaxID=4572 RepID=A0A8R7PMU6_TRIUA
SSSGGPRCRGRGAKASARSVPRVRNPRLSFLGADFKPVLARRRSTISAGFLAEHRSRFDSRPFCWRPSGGEGGEASKEVAWRWGEMGKQRNQG